jgi:choline dehydrogenase-like flavoprotein
MHDKVDVLIIGSGASGAAVAWSLADTRMRILCLEQGDWVKPADYPSNGRDWEARLFGDFAVSPNRRARPTDYPINDANSPIKVVNFNGVGGSTIMYTAHFPRLHPSDFKVRTLDGVADDWPVDYATLEPFFAENDRMMGVSGLAGDPAYPPKQPPMPPLPLGKSGTRFGKAMNQLGWHWWPSDSTIATTDYEGRARCINLGHCTPGCAQAPRPVPTSPIGRMRFAPGWSCARCAGSAKSRSTSTAWPPASSITTRRGKSISSPRRSSFWPATASARRG